jgi:hypothetical protein
MRQAIGRVKWGNIPYWPLTPHHQFLRNSSTWENHTLDHCRVFDSDSGNVPIVNVVHVSKL